MYTWHRTLTISFACWLVKNKVMKITLWAQKWIAKFCQNGWLSLTLEKLGLTGDCKLTGQHKKVIVGVLPGVEWPCRPPWKPLQNLFLLWVVREDVFTCTIPIYRRQQKCKEQKKSVLPLIYGFGPGIDLFDRFILLACARCVRHHQETKKKPSSFVPFYFILLEFTY